MSVLWVAYRNICYSAGKHLMSLLLLSTGCALLLMVDRLSRAADEQLEKNLAGVDMVLGAKGSPLQLILSALYQVDDPTGNIPFDQAQKIAMSPMVKTAVPIAYGDNYNGFRIIGTDQNYPGLFEGAASQGRFTGEDFEVCLGADVAEKSGLKPGDRIQSSHGLHDEGEDHPASLLVTGIFGETGSVLDRVILTSIPTVWRLHGHDSTAEDKEITAMLVSFKGKMALLQIPRLVNEGTTMQAAVPAIELNRLRYLMESGSRTINLMALAILFLALLSLITVFWQLVNERKYELALFKAQGSPVYRLYLLLLSESCLLVVPAYLLAQLLARLSFMFLNEVLEKSYAFGLNPLEWTLSDLLLFPVMLILAILATLLPAIRLHRLNVLRILAGS